MNISSFYAAKHQKGDIIWILPIRWWEENEPYRAVVLEDCKDYDKLIYAQSDEYGEPMYLPREFATYKKENGIKIIQKLREMKDIMEDDWGDLFMYRVFPIDAGADHG
jgi:exonuclease I